MPTFWLLAALFTGAISIVPLLPFVLGGAAIYLMITVLMRAAPARFPGPSKYYLLYICAALAYAIVIGVDVLDPSIYRRELKFVVPFGAFIIFSSFRYRAGTSLRVLRVLVTIVLVNLVLFALSPAVAQLDLSGLYVDSGNIWDVYGQGRLYLGLFYSHSAAGGWFSAFALVFLGLFLKRGVGSRQRLGTASAAAFLMLLLVLSLSRAYMLATAIVAVHAVVVIRFPKLFRGLLAVGALLVAVPMLGPFVSSGVRETDVTMLSSDELTVAEYNVMSRYVLWGQAIEDFVESPLIGVGISRFDDSAAVIATFPNEKEEYFAVKAVPDYWEYGPFRVNVGAEQAHTDQSAHNMYLQVLAEGGIVFLLLLATVIGSTVKRLQQIARRGDSLTPALAHGTVLGIYAVLVASGFGNSFMTVIPMFPLLALAGYLNSIGDLPDLDREN